MNKLQNFTQFINEAGRNLQDGHRFEKSTLLDLKIPNIGSLDPYLHIFTQCLENIYKIDSIDVDFTLEHFFEQEINKTYKEYFNENCKVHYPSKTIFIEFFKFSKILDQFFKYELINKTKTSYLDFEENIFKTICKLSPNYKNFKFQQNTHIHQPDPSDY